MKGMLLTLGRVLVGAAFLWAAVTKLSDFPTFAEEIANYQVLPASLVPWFAATLPGVELLTGVLLIVGYWARTSAAIVTVLLLVFIVALSQALLRGIDLRCGCFGGSDAATWGTVVRDLVMLVPAAAVTFAGAGRWALEGER
jgi:uncharacterized membrane protein YphA (DoxX/SURF4 family)